MTPVSFLDALKAAADQAEAAETQFKREAAQRIAIVEHERAVAFRRLNLMRRVADVAAEAEGEEIAVANTLAMLRSRLDWNDDSEARTNVLSRFAGVAQAVFRSIGPQEPGTAEPVETALADFEHWYAQSHARPFWFLFEHYIPETPLVDF